jgi:hypothetical protein
VRTPFLARGLAAIAVACTLVLLLLRIFAVPA